MSDKDERGRVDAYVVLLDRMEKLICTLSPYQRDYHVVLRVDIYWYIEKQKEIEILSNRLLQDDNVILKRYLDSLCSDIRQRIDADEQFAREYSGSSGRTGPTKKNYGSNQEKQPYHRTGKSGQ